MSDRRSLRAHFTTKLHPHCPDYDCVRKSCRASTRLTFPTYRQWTSYCTGDDYDDCPVYLGYALRSSRSCGLDRENLLVSGK